MKKIILVFILMICSVMSYAGKIATISATVDGYSGKVVDFEFIDNPDNNMSYPYTEAKKMEFEVELEEPSLLKINAWIWVIISPGDNLHLAIHYNGKKYKTAEFSGTEKAVLLNETIRDMRNSRVAIHYKMNPMAALVTQVSAEKYYQMTLEQWNKEKAMMESIKEKVDSFAYNYIYSELEGIFMSNLVKYPYMAADVFKKSLDECIPDGYWKALADYKLRDDEASLKSFTYLGWLLEYPRYIKALEAHDKGESIVYFNTGLQEGYDAIVSFYDDKLLDSALYVYLYNALSQQKEFELVESLINDYIEKYNKNKHYKDSLMSMFQ